VICELEQDDKSFPGTTLYTNPKNGHCIKQTAVYLPPNHGKTSLKLDIILWIHGFYVDDHKFLFRSDPTRLREQVLASGKDVVLIAPHLGHEYTKNKKFVGDYDVTDLATARWGERYLNQVLAAISHFQNPDVKHPPPVEVGKLIIACHSGGGVGMRNIVGTLGKYWSNLTACWGFDCLYSANAHPDDATFWYRWLGKPDAPALEIIYGPSTLPQSVKLDLIGRGIVTPEGNRAISPGPKRDKLRVTVGHYDVYMAFGQVVTVNDLDPAYVDEFMTSVLPSGVSSEKKAMEPGDFLRQMIRNARDFPFPEDIHYMIARGGFLSRLGTL
jgi:hypothetical protein